jgi:hypothetical protein
MGIKASLVSVEFDCVTCLYLRVPERLPDVLGHHVMLRRQSA